MLETFVIKHWAKHEGMVLYDASDVERQVRAHLEEAGPRTVEWEGAVKSENFTVLATDLVSGMKVPLMLAVKPTGKNGMTVMPPQ